METHEKELIEVRERSKSNTKRLDGHDEQFKEVDNEFKEIKKEMGELRETTAILKNMDYRMGNVESSIDKINSKLDGHANEKGKKWDKFIDYLFYALIAVLLGLLYTKLNLG